MLTEATEKDANRFVKILEEQEDFGNTTNSGFGREMWYSNDFFINSLILELITNLIIDR